MTLEMGVVDLGTWAKVSMTQKSPPPPFILLESESNSVSVLWTRNHSCCRKLCCEIISQWSSCQFLWEEPLELYYFLFPLWKFKSTGMNLFFFWTGFSTSRVSVFSQLKITWSFKHKRRSQGAGCVSPCLIFKCVLRIWTQFLTLVRQALSRDLSLPTLFFEAESITESRVCQFDSVGWLASPRYVWSWPPQHRILGAHCHTWLRHSCLCVKHFTSWAVSPALALNSPSCFLAFSVASKPSPAAIPAPSPAWVTVFLCSTS